MITINGVTYRNLEEQVRFNQQNINTSATAIAAETERAKAAEAANATAISNETTARANADTVIDNKLSEEISRAKTADDANSKAITDETTRATGIESNLRIDVDANTAAILAESTARDNADTATQEALTGKLNASVLSDSTATFAGTSAKATADSSGNVISSHYRAIDDSYSKLETPLRRYGRVCDNTSTAGTTWGKVADITMPVDYTDRNITFLVESGFSQHSRIIGILKLNVRNNNSTTDVNVHRFLWLVKTDNADYPLSSFVAIQNGVNVSIYVKTSFQFDGIVFSELDEYNEQGYSTFGSYALYSVINPTITDLSTVVGTQTVSTMDVIENTAASAENATNATNDDAGNRISTTYLSKADASSTYVEKSSIDSVPTASSANPVSSGGVKSALDAKQDKLESGTNIKTIEGNSILGSGDIDLDKSAVGLSNVDNTSDLDKPVSTAVQTALNGKQNKLTAGTGIIIDSSNKISADVSTSVSAIDYSNDNVALTGLALNGVNYKLAFPGNAKGNNSLAIGYNSTASTPGANAYGVSAAVTGNYGIAIGTQCTASGSNALTIGINGIAKNDDDIAIGGNSVAQNGANVALGVGSHAYGNNSIAIGDNTFNNISNTVTFDTTGINRKLIVASSDNIVFRNSNITDTGATDHNSITAVYSGATTLTNLINTSASNTLSSANSHSDNNLTTANSHSDNNLTTAKDYTDSLVCKESVVLNTTNIYHNRVGILPHVFLIYTFPEMDLETAVGSGHCILSPGWLYNDNTQQELEVSILSFNPLTISYTGSDLDLSNYNHFIYLYLNSLCINF